MNFTITLPNFEAALDQAILQEAATVLNATFRSLQGTLTQQAGEFIGRTVLNSPTAQEMQGGQLQGELGVTQPRTALAQIISAIQSSLRLDLMPVVAAGGQLSGGLELSFLRADLEDVLGIPLASFISEGGSHIEWLDWLLRAGDRIVIKTFHFQAGSFPGSRTGLGLMFHGEYWQVPAAHRGTADDNFLTRAFDAAGAELERLTVAVLEAALV